VAQSTLRLMRKDFLLGRPCCALKIVAIEDVALDRKPF
jgi:hypothetical protein